MGCFFFISKSLTNGVSFYQLNAKESVSRDRKVIVKYRNDKSKFIFNFTNNSGKNQQNKRIEFRTKVESHFLFYSDIYRRVLRLPNLEMIDMNPSEFPNIDVTCLLSSRCFLLYIDLTWFRLSSCCS